ncbi:L,D-transpeptidase [Actinomycetospora termitidis]|uniref:L,D-transpeptidase n=1 Tax=Actinomycetospora termitidis TaxID=3053470 RepID=A0ABT7M8S7_9PSEU|nr:L,D-transpeptidase [Actinomycetospora sp. Odt1-22]MDL5155833.1 L,D-transpeptidase [Actinomycetospora sp. Odt1-22]
MTRLGAASAAVMALGTLGVTTGLALTDVSLERPATVSTPAAPLAVAPPVVPVLADAGSAPSTTATRPTTTRPTTARSTTTRTATRTTSTSTSAHPMPCSIDGDGACVSLSAKRAWLVQGGEVVASAPITSGRPGERTPTGTFHVTWKDADHRSSEFDDAPMPWSVFFHGGIAFHTGSLSRQSAGCIHLSDAVAKRFFRTLSVGDTVVVTR